jgi:hypothetical protein
LATEPPPFEPQPVPPEVLEALAAEATASNAGVGRTDAGVAAVNDSPDAGVRESEQTIPVEKKAAPSAPPSPQPSSPPPRAAPGTGTKMVARPPGSPQLAQPTEGASTAE